MHEASEKYTVDYLGLSLDKGNFQFIQFRFIFLQREPYNTMSPTSNEHPTATDIITTMYVNA